MGRRLGRGQMPLERCPQAAAAAVQQHPLISVADLQDVTNFLRGPSLHITEGYDLALRRRQGGDRPGDDAHRLLRQELLFRRLSPAARRHPPVERGDWIARRPKSVARYRQLLVTVPDVDPGCRERNRPRLAVGTRAGAVYEDPEQPRLERRPRLESIDPL